MLRKIAVSDLTLGMYIHEFCRPRVHDPFWNLHVERELCDEAVLQRIQASAREVWIDTRRGKTPNVQVQILGVSSTSACESDTTRHQSAWRKNCRAPE